MTVLPRAAGRAQAGAIQTYATSTAQRTPLLPAQPALPCTLAHALLLRIACAVAVAVVGARGIAAVFASVALPTVAHTVVARAVATAVGRAAFGRRHLTPLPTPSVGAVVAGPIVQITQTMAGAVVPARRELTGSTIVLGKALASAALPARQCLANTTLVAVFLAALEAAVGAGVPLLTVAAALNAVPLPTARIGAAGCVARLALPTRIAIASAVVARATPATVLRARLLTTARARPARQTEAHTTRTSSPVVAVVGAATHSTGGALKLRKAVTVAVAAVAVGVALLRAHTQRAVVPAEASLALTGATLGALSPLLPATAVGANFGTTVVPTKPWLTVARASSAVTVTAASFGARLLLTGRTLPSLLARTASIHTGAVHAGRGAGTLRALVAGVSIITHAGEVAAAAVTRAGLGRVVTGAHRFGAVLTTVLVIAHALALQAVAVPRAFVQLVTVASSAVGPGEALVAHTLLAHAFAVLRAVVGAGELRAIGSRKVGVAVAASVDTVAATRAIIGAHSEAAVNISPTLRATTAERCTFAMSSGR